MKIDVLPDADAVARHAASFLAAAARIAASAHGRCTLAVSGGHTPWAMLRALANEDVPWRQLHVFQVDERIAPAGDPDRNLTHIQESLAQTPLAPEQLHPMPVDDADPAAAAARYARLLRELSGDPPVLDLVHLGLGPDGHTASLVPGDAVLGVNDVDVALTSTAYQNRRRMTVTYPLLNRARQILWVVTGAEKVDALAKLRAADASIPAGRVNQANAIALADRAAAEPS